MSKCHLETRHCFIRAKLRIRTWTIIPIKMHFEVKIATFIIINKLEMAFCWTNKLTIYLQPSLKKHDEKIFIITKHIPMY